MKKVTLFFASTLVLGLVACNTASTESQEPVELVDSVEVEMVSADSELVVTAVDSIEIDTVEVK